MQCKWFRYLFVVGVMALLAACQPSAEREMVTITGQTMGTTYTVKYINDQHDLDPQQVKTEIEARLQEVNRQMSTYLEDSEISQFNQMKAGEMPISDDFATVVKEAIRLNKVTHGALDVTVGPVVNLWGFGPDKTVLSSPTDEQLAQAKRVVGIDKIELKSLASSDGHENAASTSAAPAQAHHKFLLSKKVDGVYLDLSSIAKGFGVDKIAFYLDELKLKNYLVEIGGELRAKGQNLQKKPWSIGIEQPTVLQHQANQLVLPLENLAMATSGDYRNFHLDAQGNRLSHIINPQTFSPIHHRLASITVIQSSTMTADGLATGLFVLGEDKALELAEQEKIPVFMIIQSGEGFETKMSSAFKSLIQ